MRPFRRTERVNYGFQEIYQANYGHRCCRSCNVGQLTNKRISWKSPMVERSILTIPFESLAVDIVGPFPKCKGGVRYVLTTLCVATKWPDAVPLQSEQQRQ